MSDEMPRVDDCWNRIGVWAAGGERCPRLAEVVHCRNCEVFVTAGRQIFEREVPGDYLRENLAVLAAGGEEESREGVGVMVFRLGGEYFALPMPVFDSVNAARPVHRLPHIANPFVRGVVNIAGEVCLCHALDSLLDVRPSTAGDGEGRAARRLMVVRLDGQRYVFPVDEVLGMSRYRAGELDPPPATLGEALRQLSRGSFVDQDRRVAVLDIEALRRILDSGGLGA